MKKINFLLILSALILFSCKKEEPNELPQCTIKYPLLNSTYFVDDNIEIVVDAQDTDGTITGVEIFLNGNSIVILSSSPFEYTWEIKDIGPGQYTLKAEVTDDKGDQFSSEREIKIMPAPEEFTDSRDGNVYRYVTIGNQIWMADNLAYLPSVSPSAEESNTALLYYVSGYEGNDVAAAKNEDNYSLYGVLYNWKAAIGCCPDGWHLPTDNEWIILENFINGEQGPFDKITSNWGYTWEELAQHLCHTSGWFDNKGINTYGFSALPGCGVTFGTDPENCEVCLCAAQEATAWWTLTSSGYLASSRGLSTEDPINVAKHNDYPKEFGLSVRCVKDTIEDSNASPFCNFKCPISNSTYFADENIEIIVSAADIDGTVTSVEIILDGNSIAILNSSPYEYTYEIKDVDPGEYKLKAEVMDDKGAIGSSQIDIHIIPILEKFTDPRDGNVYRYVTIGDQIWMADNLAYLPAVSPPTVKSNTTSLYYVLEYKGNDVAAAKNEDNYSLYGVLYNWTAAISCCPDGWHLPTDNEWVKLENFINSDQGPFNKHYEGSGYYWEGMARHLKHTSGWLRLSGINTYGFSALPAGGMIFEPFPGDCGICYYADWEATAWWTATTSYTSSIAIVRDLWAKYPTNIAKLGEYPKGFGLSVRCVKDK